jgi:soluble lytic murein transglycosylase-like protein
LSRILVIVALFVLFSLLALPARILAQTPDSHFEQKGNTGARKNVVSLTTTDLLSSQDFAPQNADLPATRKRSVISTKRAKTTSEAKPRGGSETMEVASAGLKVSGFEPTSDVMAPAQKPELKTYNAAEEKPFDNQTSGFITGRSPLDSLIAQSAARNGIDPQLILAVMRQESSFNAQAVSYKGARGLMQLMPATAARFGVRDIFDPAQNIEGGSRYLRFLLDTFNGNVELALAGYNAGENAVMRYGYQIPPYRETQDYVRKISAHYARLKGGNFVSPQVARQVLVATPKNDKKAEVEIFSVGATMTQY